MIHIIAITVICYIYPWQLPYHNSTNTNDLYITPEGYNSNV